LRCQCNTCKPLMPHPAAFTLLCPAPLYAPADVKHWRKVQQGLAAAGPGEAEAPLQMPSSSSGATSTPELPPQGPPVNRQPVGKHQGRTSLGAADSPSFAAELVNAAVAVGGSQHSGSAGSVTKPAALHRRDRAHSSQQPACSASSSNASSASHGSTSALRAAVQSMLGACFRSQPPATHSPPPPSASLATAPPQSPASGAQQAQLFGSPERAPAPGAGTSAPQNSPAASDAGAAGGQSPAAATATPFHSAFSTQLPASAGPRPAPGIAQHSCSGSALPGPGADSLSKQLFAVEGAEAPLAPRAAAVQEEQEEPLQQQEEEQQEEAAPALAGSPARPAAAGAHGAAAWPVEPQDGGDSPAFVRPPAPAASAPEQPAAGAEPARQLLQFNWAQRVRQPGSSGSGGDQPVDSADTAAAGAAAASAEGAGAGSTGTACSSSAGSPSAASLPLVNPFACNPALARQLSGSAQQLPATLPADPPAAVEEQEVDSAPQAAPLPEAVPSQHEDLVLPLPQQPAEVEEEASAAPAPAEQQHPAAQQVASATAVQLRSTASAAQAAAAPPRRRWDVPTAAHPAAPRASIFTLQSRWGRPAAACRRLSRLLTCWAHKHGQPPPPPTAPDTSICQPSPARRRAALQHSANSARPTALPAGQGPLFANLAALRRQRQQAVATAAAQPWRSPQRSTAAAPPTVPAAGSPGASPRPHWLPPGPNMSPSAALPAAPRRSPGNGSPHLQSSPAGPPAKHQQQQPSQLSPASKPTRSAASDENSGSGTKPPKSGQGSNVVAAARMAARHHARPQQHSPLSPISASVNQPCTAASSAPAQGLVGQPQLLGTTRLVSPSPPAAYTPPGGPAGLLPSRLLLGCASAVDATPEGAALSSTGGLPATYDSSQCMRLTEVGWGGAPALAPA
jgi:hypothetical protein